MNDSSQASSSRSPNTISATAFRSISPSLSRTRLPHRATRAPFTSSSRYSSCTISSADATAAPWRANARSASDLPAPIPPVIATLRGCFWLRIVVRGGLVGRDRRGGLGRLGRVGRVGEDLVRKAEVRRVAVLGRIVVDPLQREREPPALAVHLEDQHLDGVALRNDLARVLDVVLRELRDVHQTLDAREDLNERAERDHLRHLALDDVAFLVL